eukprot:GDKJ01019405.1.p1 GENE.GDKJ01019405.1~~GDKJ01019405.1.p1  ORF type:complete len:728 (-),score=179.27 GDKJ01019405.1:52-2235(-)
MGNLYCKMTKTKQVEEIIFKGNVFKINEFVELMPDSSSSSNELWIGKIEHITVPASHENDLDASNIVLDILWCAQPQYMIETIPATRDLITYMGERELMLSVDQRNSNEMNSVIRKVNVLEYNDWLKYDEPPAQSFYYRLQFSINSREIIGSLPVEVHTIKEGRRTTVPRNPDEVYEKCKECNKVFDPVVFPHLFPARRRALQKTRPSQSDNIFTCGFCSASATKSAHSTTSHHPIESARVAGEGEAHAMPAPNNRPACPSVLDPIRDATVMEKRRTFLSRIHENLWTGYWELTASPEMKSKWKSTLDKLKTPSVIDSLAQEIERSVYKEFSHSINDWQQRALAVRRNISAEDNFSLRSRALSGKFTPQMFATEPVGCLAPEALQEARREAEEQYLRREVLLADEAVQLVRKTHKGEEFVFTPDSRPVVTSSSEANAAVEGGKKRTKEESDSSFSANKRVKTMSETAIKVEEGEKKHLVAEVFIPEEDEEADADLSDFDDDMSQHFGFNFTSSAHTYVDMERDDDQEDNEEEQRKSFREDLEKLEDGNVSSGSFPPEAFINFKGDASLTEQAVYEDRRKSYTALAKKVRDLRVELNVAAATHQPNRCVPPERLKDKFQSTPDAIFKTLSFFNWNLGTQLATVAFGKNDASEVAVASHLSSSTPIMAHLASGTCDVEMYHRIALCLQNQSHEMRKKFEPVALDRRECEIVLERAKERQRSDHKKKMKR